MTREEKTSNSSSKQGSLVVVVSEFQERIPVTVVPLPFYDPEEERSRS